MYVLCSDVLCRLCRCCCATGRWPAVAGGVVLITTKKGESGSVKVEYSGTLTVKTVGLMPELMNIDQWADGVMTALENDGNTSNTWYTYAQLAKKYKGSYLDLHKTSSPFGSAAFTDVHDFVFDDSVNWLGSLFGSSSSTEQSLSLSGGSDKHSYRISLSYLYDGSTLQYGNNNNQRYNFRVNNSYNLSDALTLESSIAYNRQEQVAPSRITAVLTTSALDHYRRQGIRLGYLGVARSQGGRRG